MDVALREVVYRYVPESNPGGGSLPGLPLRDLTQADLEQVPGWLRPSIEACPFYERVALASGQPEELDHGNPV